MTVSILDPKTMKPFQRPRAHALVGSGNLPFDAADISSEVTASWRPTLWSADGERNMFRDRIVARIRDVARNDGWASGGLTRIIDNVIGASFRPVAKPHYRYLAHYTGNTAFDAVWADEYGRAVETHWKNWADDPAKWCDIERGQTVTQMMRLSFRHLLTDGDALAILPFEPDRIGYGRARYATAIQVIDPDRLSNPNLQFDQRHMRGGVEIDRYGAASGYYIRRAHQGDWFSAAESVTWDLVPRETPWGRPIVVHNFEHDRAGQHRGSGGVLTPVLIKMRELIQYDTAELRSAILNATFAAYVTSPFDPSLIGEALGEGDGLDHYQQERSDFHAANRTMLGESKLPILYPGEAITSVAATRPVSNFDAFQQATLRNISAALGLSAEQLSQDWSRTNYSSARAALLEAWKTLSRRRNDFGVGFSIPIYLAFLEESHEIDDLPMPRGQVPDFPECRAAYGGVKWIGPGRGWVDPVKEKQAAILGIESGLSTLEDEAMEQGRYWEDDLEQRITERLRYKAAYKAAGLDEPLPNTQVTQADFADDPQREAGGSPGPAR